MEVCCISLSSVPFREYSCNHFELLVAWYDIFIFVATMLDFPAFVVWMYVTYHFVGVFRLVLSRKKQNLSANIASSTETADSTYLSLLYRWYGKLFLFLFGYWINQKLEFVEGISSVCHCSKSLILLLKILTVPVCVQVAH